MTIMMKSDSTQLPIALRRTPRRATARLPGAETETPTPALNRLRHSQVSKTPSAAAPPTRPRKRARPSEIDNDSTTLVADDTDDSVRHHPTASAATAGSTNRPATTHRAVPATKRRKTEQPSGSAKPARRTDTSGLTDSGCSEVRIFPLRAILDDRVKRRIRRNGLSEEMNTIYDDRKQRTKKTAKELDRLREQIAAKEAENARLREESSLVQDTSRIHELEREVADLRRGLDTSGLGPAGQSDRNFDDWDMVAGDGFSDHSSLADTDDQFADDTTVGVGSSSPPVHPKLYVDSVPTTMTPPSTSPIKSATPELPCDVLSRTKSLCTSGSDVQARRADHSIDAVALEKELSSLRSELASLNRAVQDQQQLEMDLRAKLASAQDSRSSAEEGDPDLQLQMDMTVQVLAEKTAALADINKSLSSLGPRGADARQVVASLKAAFKSARQELQDLAPPGDPLVLSCQGAEVLELALQRLREAARQSMDHECLLERYRHLEQGLRQQLQDRVDAMTKLGCELRRKDDRIFQLEDSVERLQAAVEGYRVSLADLEALVGRMETEHKNAQAKLAGDVQSEREAAAQKDDQLAEMASKLASMFSITADLRAQLAQAHVDREVEMAIVEASHDSELTLRDARLAELQDRVTGLEETLSQAHQSISQLRAENGRLQGDADRDKKAARDTVASLRTQLLQTLQMSEAFLAPSAE